MKKQLLIISLSLITFLAYADVKLPRLVSDGMVLQRDQKVKIWGWADQGENIKLDFRNKSYQTQADNMGNWSIELPQMKAGGPYQMSIVGKNKVELQNILVGDVWICSGQSNMELPVDRVKVKYPGLVENSKNNYIRHFAVNTTYEFNELKKDFATGEWRTASPENVGAFTAVGYFFAKALYEKYHVPIGLIRIAVGGSPAEAWLPEQSIAKYPNYNQLLKKYQHKATVDSIIRADKAGVDAWNSRIDQEDSGLKDHWLNNDYNFANWDKMSVPGLWKTNPFIANEQEAHLNVVGNVRNSGVIWFKKEVNLTRSQLNQPAMLILGALVDRDEAYVNGAKVGTTGYQYPPRRYNVPEGTLKEGKNIITVRLVANNRNGGFVPDKFYGLTLGKDTVSLTGDWYYKVGYASTPMPSNQVTFHYQPSSLFNALVAPLKNYAKKGVIWYQGESNTKNPKEYENLFADLVKDWRTYFNQPKMPFLYVQLANFMEESAVPQESNWAEMREVQRKALEIPHTAMAVITDVGEWNDIHPLDKKAVGDRLALAAEKVAYGDKKVVYSGPTLKSYEIKNGQFILTFENVGSGLMSRNNEELKHFAVADASGDFKWAKAKIEGNKVIVWSDEVKDPKRLRYGWSHNPAKANLYNKEGLPASAFQVP
ncbi:sialate O-acetylesterase [Pseudopedobacter beijingensis]|uniref:Sialate O-acetylesterase n=1 Tax=Pseudopedobacter beijingensis TaxID=1207056 RepID=A0ABW4I8X1_9SPHI